MDTLTKSCSPTTVITANGEVQTHEEATVCVKELGIFLTMKVLENTPAVLSLGKLCDENGYSYEWINGQKPHLIKNGTRIICNTENFANQNPKPNEKEPKIERDDPLCSEIPEWLQEFREKLVDDVMHEHGDSHASSFHEVSLEPTFKRRDDLCKHSVYTHIPKTELARSVRGLK